VNEVELWLGNPIFASAGPEVCEALVERYPARRHAPGEKIVTAGEAIEHLHVLLDGAVRVYHQNPDGLEITVKLLRAPVVYGDIELFHDLPFLECVGAIDEALIARIPRADYDELLDRHPAAMRAHLHHLSAAFCVSARNEQQLFASLDRRIANLLLAYAKVERDKGGFGDRPAVRLSQAAIAQSLGVVRRSVAGVLAGFAKDGVVRKRGESLVLERPEVLEQLAAPIADSLPYWIGMPFSTSSVGPVSDSNQGGLLELLAGPATITTPRITVDRELVLGNDETCDFPLADDSVAPRHCRIFRSARGGRYWIQALSAKQPTRVNGEPITRAVLRDGDTIALGEVRLRLRLVPR